MPKWFVGRKSGGSLVGFLGVVFFLFLADAILSAWVPGFVERVMGSALKMGLVVAFSSVVGLGMDFVFSEILEGSSVKRVIWWSILGCSVFIGLLGWAVWQPMVGVLLLAMAAWGFYYDLFGFFTQQFVAETTAKPLRAAVWSVVGLVRNLAYFIGPIVGADLVGKGGGMVVVGAGGVLVGAGLLLSGVRFKKGGEEFTHKKVGMRAEMEHWQVLFTRVWPVLVMSLVLGWIDATYWTVGTIVSDKLARKNFWGGMFLPFYVLPFLLMGVLMSRIKLKKGKKKMALRFLMGGGILMGMLEWGESLGWKLGIVLVSSTLLAVSWPLVNAVYTDLVERMGRKREHLLGLSDSMMNIAYIGGPIVGGGIASWVGEEKTFVVVGWIVVLIGVILQVVMPAKLRLPQKEMEKWE